MAGTSEDRLVAPPQSGIATAVFRKCLTEPFARAFGVDIGESRRRLIAPGS